MGAKKTAGRLFGFALIVLLVLVLIKQPTTAGNAVADVWGWFNDTAAQLATFANSLFN